jgi:ubiquinone/menaquinone biosynthesis C-methylase UbiE
MGMDAVAQQRKYYRQTANQYDSMHIGDPEHEFALAAMVGWLQHFDIRSVLDVGSGTGRALAAIKRSASLVSVIGIEPSDELRAIGYRKGLSESELIDGDAQALPFPDNSFDLVCAFGVMHHVPNPDKAAREMVRVARRAVLISDHNDPGRGTPRTKLLKQIIKSAGVWGLYKLAITRGKGYRITDDDGLWYPYSVLDTCKTMALLCPEIHFLGTKPSGPNLFSASHVAIMGLKRQSDLVAKPDSGG